MKIVLVTGTRSELSQQEMHFVQSALINEKPDLVVHGDCPTGVDKAIDDQAHFMGIPVIPMPARWNYYDMCKVVAMLVTYGHEAVCLAFLRETKWSGIRNCMQAAEKWSIPVKEFPLAD